MTCFNFDMRLCDDRGLISHEVIDPPYDGPVKAPGLTYYQQHNNLAGVTGQEPWTGEPIACTGHAHLAHMHIRCTSPVHIVNVLPDQPPSSNKGGHVIKTFTSDE